jgi:hypothetical protein
MTTRAREILLTGSVPLRPAEKVFETVARHLGTLAPRIPDGEQIGWSSAARRTFERHPALEVKRQVALNAGGRDPVDIFSLKPGFAAEDLKLGPYGYAENAANSYAAFKRLRDAGVIAPGTRYQATLAGPGTSAFCIELPAEQLLPLAREALLQEMNGIIAAVPAEDLTIQLDIGMEAEHEEYLRRPEAWDQPLHTVFHWTLDQMADSVAWLSNKIPDEVELGFHVCSIWHHDPDGGQDNRVLVDAANAILSRVARPVGYVHIPVIPDHVAADYAAFKELDLPSATKLYLGLVNLADGIEGAKRRIALAEAFVSDFGIGSFCGLGRPPSPDAQGPRAHSHPPIPALKRATPDTIGAVLDLHREIALL